MDCSEFSFVLITYVWGIKYSLIWCFGFVKDTSYVTPFVYLAVSLVTGRKWFVYRLHRS